MKQILNLLQTIILLQLIWVSSVWADVYLPVNTLPDLQLTLQVHQVSPRPIANVATVKLGNTVTFSFSSSKSGYVSLWNIGTSDKVYRLFPNQYEKNMHIIANKTYKVAGNRADYEIQTQAPIGMENVYLLWTRQKHQQPQTVTAANLQIGSRSYRARDLNIIQKHSKRNWATARVAFEVTHDGKPQIEQFNHANARDLRARGVSGRVFLLAMGANTGGLTKTASDATSFTNTMKKLFRGKILVRLHPNAYVRDFRAGMQWLKNKVRSDDTVIIYFSGHGSTLPDNNHDENDGTDEVFVMSDARNIKRANAHHVVRDDQFAHWIKQIRSNKIITILDACYSGGLMRGGFEASASRNKFYIGGLLGLRGSSKRDRRRGGIDVLKGVAIVAAGERQSAIEGLRGGVLTTHIVREISNIRNSGKSLYNVINSASRIARHQSKMNPSIIGNTRLLKSIMIHH